MQCLRRRDRFLFFLFAFPSPTSREGGRFLMCFSSVLITPFSPHRLPPLLPPSQQRRDTSTVKNLGDNGGISPPDDSHHHWTDGWWWCTHVGMCMCFLHLSNCILQKYHIWNFCSSVLPSNTPESEHRGDFLLWFLFSISSSDGCPGRELWPDNGGGSPWGGGPLQSPQCYDGHAHEQSPWIHRDGSRPEGQEEDRCLESLITRAMEACLPFFWQEQRCLLLLFMCDEYSHLFCQLSRETLWEWTRLGRGYCSWPMRLTWKMGYRFGIPSWGSM